jgi:hypothetical protein
VDREICSKERDVTYLAEGPLEERSERFLYGAQISQLKQFNIFLAFAKTLKKELASAVSETAPIQISFKFGI